MILNYNPRKATPKSTRGEWNVNVARKNRALVERSYHELQGYVDRVKESLQRALQEKYNLNTLVRGVLSIVNDMQQVLDRQATTTHLAIGEHERVFTEGFVPKPPLSRRELKEETQITVQDILRTPAKKDSRRPTPLSPATPPSPTRTPRTPRRGTAFPPTPHKNSSPAITFLRNPKIAGTVAHAHVKFLNALRGSDEVSETGPTQVQVYCTVALMLQSVVDHLGAECGTLWQHLAKTDELQVIAQVGLRTKGFQHRITANVGMQGAVMGSGVGLNYQLPSRKGDDREEDSNRVHAALLDMQSLAHRVNLATAPPGNTSSGRPTSPTTPSTTHSHRGSGKRNSEIPDLKKPGANSKGDEPGQYTKIVTALLLPLRVPQTNEVFGVLEIDNKKDGLNFSEEDEAIVNTMLPLFSYILRTFPIHLDPNSDPRNIPSFGTLNYQPEQSSSEIKSLLPAFIQEHKSPQLIYRTTQSGKFVRKKAIHSGATQVPTVVGSASLREVDSYMNNLQDCWKQSLDISLQYQHKAQERSTAIRDMHELLMAEHSKVSQLEHHIAKHKWEWPDWFDAAESDVASSSNQRSAR
eukprot:TRINITY_DN61516_c0_g1_i1.p1 TRINITY_DN61516_c0_g1~~TRINITY_DN61516_c0_g1_i1.p1  ORF type:complete len:581 (+),score=25.31 TRINITY_DN61516_c0_g1_i1:35-1777(+)